MSSDSVLSELRWKKFSVLDDGFVCLVDAMGTDASVVQAARVSYGKDERDHYETKKCHHCGSEDIDQDKEGLHCNSCGYVSDPCELSRPDVGLIRYMMRNGHGTPFEMCEIKCLMRIPMDAWRQFVRHRTLNINEYSTRYSEAIDSAQKTEPDKWRLQSGTNKQGSDGFLPAEAQDDSPLIGAGHIACGLNLTKDEELLHNSSRSVYERRLKAGVAREQARKDLPLSTYTEAYVKCDLRNWFHFLSLRMDSHAQWEIRQYATIIGEEIIAKLFPVCWEAFRDYRLNSMSLSAIDIDVISGNKKLSEIENKRERAECRAKIEKLGIDVK